MDENTKSPLLLMRKKRELSLLALATAIGVSEAHMSRVERGEVKPSPLLADRLAKYFDNAVTRDQILFPEDYPAPTRKTARSA